MDIFKPTQEFEFNKITLGNPLPIQGGAFFSKVIFSDNEKELFIQLPKCTTKQAIISTKRGKYCDLMYSRDQNETFFNWLEKLETVFHGLIDKNKNLWFTGDYSKDDIENMMSPITRMYKSGEYILIRVYINSNKHTGEDKCSVYNEDEVNIDINTIVPETNIIPLVLIDGVKFTSRSFELDIKLSQLMVLKEPVALKKCLIRVSDEIEKNISSSNVKEEPASQQASQQASHPVSQQTALKQASHITQTIKEEIKEVISDISNTIAKNKKALDNEEEINEDEINDDEDNEGNEDDEDAADENKESVSVNKYNTNLEEVNLENIIQENNLERIKLKKPNEVYYDIYRSAREKAKNMRKLAIQAYLEAKEIKTKYILEDIDISDDDEENEYKL
jgi:hypothetical protein